jgi:hypothetical protein
MVNVNCKLFFYFSLQLLNGVNYGACGVLYACLYWGCVLIGGRLCKALFMSLYACLVGIWLYMVGDVWVIGAGLAILRIGAYGRITYDRGGMYGDVCPDHVIWCIRWGVMYGWVHVSAWCMGACNRAI